MRLKLAGGERAVAIGGGSALSEKVVIDGLSCELISQVRLEG